MSELRDDLMATVSALGGSTDQDDNLSLENTQNDDQGQEDLGTGEQAEGRDASGRFTPKTPAKDSLLADKEPGTEEADPLKPEDQTQQPAQQQAPVGRAPASWKPEEREGWEKMDPRHQAAVSRREREITQTLAQTAGMRNFANEIAQTLNPYMAMIQAEGSTPARAIAEVMKTAAFLRSGPSQGKAAAIADLIQTYGIDVMELDRVLTARRDGNPQGQRQDTSGIQQLLQQQLAPIQEFMTSIQSQRQQAQQRVTQQAQQTLGQFMEDPANEFAEDVREDMADLLELAANRGHTLSLQDAYKRATLAHPTISQIVSRRQAQQSATQQSAAAQRARNASVSPSGSGAPTQSNDGESDGSLRSDIMSSVRTLASSRR